MAAVLLLGLAGIAFWPKGGVMPVADRGPKGTETFADVSKSSTSAPLRPQDGMASAPLWPATDGSDKNPKTAAAVPSPSVAESQPMPSGGMTSSADAGLARSTAAPVVPENPVQKPSMSLDDLEKLAEKAIVDRDEQEMTRLRELLKQHPAAVPRVVRLADRLASPGAARRAPQESIGRRLAILGLARLDSGDEFGAYLLARSARAEWQGSSPWWTSEAVKTLVAEGPARFPMQNHGTYDSARGGVATIPEESLKQNLAEKTHDSWPRGAVRVFCENEAVETRLFVECERGCVLLRERGYSGGGDAQSGDVVVVAHSPQKGTPRLRISGLRHHPAEIEPRFSKEGAYWGAVVLHELSATEIGELQLRLEPESGLTTTELVDALQLRLAPNPYWMMPIPDWTLPPESWAGNLLQIAPAKYAIQVQCSQASTPIQQGVEVRAGELRDVKLPLFRRRQVTLQWKYRPQPDAEVVEGTSTVMTGASVMMTRWEGYARNVFLKVDDWDGRGCRLSVSNAFARTVPDGTWNSPTWLSPKGTNWLDDAPIEVGTTILLGNAIRGSEVFTALVRVRQIEVPGAAAPQE